MYVILVMKAFRVILCVVVMEIVQIRSVNATLDGRVHIAEMLTVLVNQIARIEEHALLCQILCLFAPVILVSEALVVQS